MRLPLVTLLLLGWVQAVYGGTETVPDRALRERPLTYPGSGEELRAPAGVREIRIVWFGPSAPSAPVAPRSDDPWLAASLAVEEANRDGGYHGIPFHLIPTWSDGPWGSGVAQLTRLAFDPDVLAILGSVDGASTHLAEQVAARARLPVLNPAATDATLHLAGVPWMFSCPPGDHRIVPVLADALRDRDLRRYVLVSSLDHDARVFSDALLHRLGESGESPLRHLPILPDQDEGELAARILEDEPEAVVVIAGAATAGRLVAGLRDRGFAGAILGGPDLARRAFPETAGVAAEGTLVPLLVDPGPLAAFREIFEARHGRDADPSAAHAYDAARLLIASIRKAGLDRAGIRDALASMPPTSGVTGLIDWDAVGQNRREVQLGIVRDGRVREIRGR